MSRTGNKAIDLPQGVTATVENQRTVMVSGPKGKLAISLAVPMQAQVAGGKITIARPDDLPLSKRLHGLSRTLVANMVEGVTKGYSKDLEIQGVGFKAAVQGQKLSLSLGFCGPKEFVVPEGVKVTVTPDGLSLQVSGADKQKVGDTAARIVSYYPAEPYKGKGVRFKGAYVRRKVGKTVA